MNRLHCPPSSVQRSAHQLRRLLIAVLFAAAAGCSGTPKTVSDQRIDCSRPGCDLSCAIYERAEKGKANAQFALGESYWHGYDGCFPRDYESGLSWHRKAAAAGETRSMTRIADAYRDGLGVPQDSLTAMEWYRKALEAGHRTADARTGYATLAAQNAGQTIRDGARAIALPRTIAVAARWEAGAPELARPRGAAAEVVGRLVSSAAVGGAFALAGDPVRGAAFGGLLAVYGIPDGIRSGKAGNAVYRDLDARLAETDFEELLREELRHQIGESDLEPASRVLPAEDETAAELLIDVSLAGAELRNTNSAWQFQGATRPGLVLTMTAAVHASWTIADGTSFRETLRYRGHGSLDGGEQQFLAEMRRAARHMTGRILLRLTDGAGPAEARVTVRGGPR